MTTADAGRLETVTMLRGSVPATLVDPASGDRPRRAVVVVQDARGITPYLASVCHRLADAGWLAVAPHLYHRDGIAEVDRAGSWATATQQMTTLTGVGIAADVDACLGHLAEVGIEPHRTAAIGFCMGGTVALFTATRHALGAAVSFYGGGVSRPYWDDVPPLLELAPQLRTPWLGLYGEADALITMAEIEALRAATAQAGVATELVTYPDAGHAFHSDDREAVYRPSAAADAWKRAMTFLDRTVGTGKRVGSQPGDGSR